MAAQKKLILNAFVESCSGHQSPGLWQHPRDQSWRFNEVSHWVNLAKKLEEGKFHGVFIADVLVRRFQCGVLTRAANIYIRVPMMSTKVLETPILPLVRERSGL